ncbi:MAG: ATP-binding protein [Chloroflexota bacterium]|nr:ATP-binding protein [Chloroflexota bacterium]
MESTSRIGLRLSGGAYTALQSLLGAVAHTIGAGQVCLITPSHDPECITLVQSGETSNAGQPFESHNGDVTVPVRYGDRELAQLVVTNPPTRLDPDRLDGFARAAGYILGHADQVSRAESAIEETRVLRELGMRLGQPTDLQELLDSMLAGVRRVLAADYASISMVEPDGTTRWLAMDGFRNTTFRDRIFPAGHGVSGRTIAAGRPVVLSGIGTDPDLPPEDFTVHVAEGGVSALGVPLVAGGKVIGALVLGSRTDREWQQHEIELATVIANGAAVAIDQNRVQRAESAQRHFLQAVIENYPGILLVMGPPPDWRIIHANSNFNRLLPEPYRSGQSVVGLSILELGTRTSERSEATRQMLAHVFATGEPVSFEQYESESPEAGTTYWNWQALPVDNLTGDGGRSLMLIANDVTDVVRSRHAAQEGAETARARAEELEMIISHMADGVMIFDRNGEVLRMNPAAEMLLGQGVLPGALPEAHPFLYGLFTPEGELYEAEQLPSTRALRGEVIVGENVLVRRPNHPETILGVSCAPLSGPQGEIIGSVAVLHDITQDKLVERLKDEFLSIVSHELRTPLTAIIGYSDLMLRGVHGALADRQAKVLNSVRANADRLLRLINDLLDVSKLESGAVQLRLDPVDLGEIATRTIAQTRILAMNASVQISNLLPNRHLNKVQADDQKLQQVFENLITNAIKHSAGGSITIDGYLTPLEPDDPGLPVYEPPAQPLEQEQARSLVVSVHDTGVGLEADQLARIWDKFYQVDTTVKRRSGGAGLGLTIVRNLVDLHSGQVWAYSAGSGKGSTFSFSLPIVQGEYGTYARPGDRTPAAIRPAEQRRDRQPAIGTVLVAEDDADQREIICDMLELEGFEVVLAETGEEALELATQIMPSAIALDVILPRRDGWEVLEALRQDPRTRDIPVLIISVVDQTDFGKKLGADEYLLKPLDPRSLRTAIRRLVLAHERDAAAKKQNN